MWYVMQVRTGSEENTLIHCKKNIPATILESCFIPYYEEKKRFGGQWKTLKKILFPGYLFVVSNDVEQLYLNLKTVQGLTKLIGAGTDIIPLSDREIEFLQSFGGENQVVEMSQGIIEGDRIVIQSGPLMGKEGLIRKIDRHKRKAWLELEMFGRLQKVEIGLEITKKI